MKHTMIAVLMGFMIAGCSVQKQTSHDFVSSYDFKTALLEDLPWEMGEAIVGTEAAFDYDDFVRKHHRSWNYVQHWMGEPLFMDLSYSTNDVWVVDDPATVIPQYDRIDSESCRLKGGELWHALYCTNGVVRVDRDGYGMINLGVEPLEYGDFNQDGYMDVLVRRVLGGSACPMEELVLSRKQPSGQFYVVEVQRGSVRVHSGKSLLWEKNANGTRKSWTHIFVSDGMTVADLAEQYEVPEEVIRSANDLGRSGEIRKGTWVIIPDRE